jgi:GTP-binding protein
MRFIDEATIEVVSGHGGPGIVSFRRESKVARGGPDGGDGGRGGDVIAWADPGTTTLLDHRYRRWYRADAGDKGGKSQSSGASAEDLVIPLPRGTVISDSVTGEVIADLVESDTRIVLATGGRGGKGNAFFTSSTRQAPRYAQEGEEGEERRLDLSLKLVADVGIVGLPNAGKSTFIRKVSRSKARVADYPFTTLVPNLGVARVDERVLVIADIPGLVAGAHEGHGLGDRFLKHVERTRALIHLVSLSPDAPDPLEAFEIIDHELRAHSPELAERPRVVVLNKIDLVSDRYELELWSQAFNERGITILSTSALTGESTLEVLREVLRVIAQGDAAEAEDDQDWSPI